MTISLLAILQASPNPTHKAGAKVPLLNPLSYPPPFIMGIRRTLGYLRTYKAPIPLGPYILCEDIDIKSIFIALTSIGILPKL